MNDHGEYAARMLCHYLRLLFEKSGLRWDGDNAAEVRDIVKAIIQAAIEPS